jgi:hypothetical protein
MARDIANMGSEDHSLLMKSPPPFGGDISNENDVSKSAPFVVCVEKTSKINLLFFSMDELLMPFGLFTMPLLLHMYHCVLIQRHTVNQNLIYSVVEAFDIILCSKCPVKIKVEIC